MLFPKILTTSNFSLIILILQFQHKDCRREVLKNKMANQIKPCDQNCYCKPKMATHSTSPPPPAVDLELLQRYVRLRENGKFLNLKINCSDGSTRSVHKYILNSLSVNLGRSIQACKYSYHSNKRTCLLIFSEKVPANPLLLKVS